MSDDDAVSHGAVPKSTKFVCCVVCGDPIRYGWVGGGPFDRCACEPNDPTEPPDMVGLDWAKWRERRLSGLGKSVWRGRNT